MKLPTNHRQVIDEFGAVQEKIETAAAKIKPLKEREKELREQILGWAENLPDDEACSVDGGNYALSISERRIERTIKSMKRVFTVLGEKTFLACCSFPLKALKQELLPDQVAKLVDETSTGPREVIATPRLAAKRKAV